MSELWTALSHWFSANETLLFWVSIGSAVMLVGSILALPWLVGRIPEAYFLHQQAPVARPFQGHPLLGFGFHLLRNLLALVLITAGFLMLFYQDRGYSPCYWGS